MSYSMRGRAAATAATADHAVFSIWNPHSTHRIKVISFAMFAQVAPTAGWTGRFRRISARGTAGSTVTPNSSNHSELAVAPVSGVLLDLAQYSAQPTLLASSVDMLLGYPYPATIGAGIIYPIPGGVIVPPGAGIAYIQVPATASTAMEVAVTWLEDWL
jgi:hypothetical protein